MLRISKKADYALMAMKHLAGEARDGAVTAREIAERYDVPLELLAKVLQQLARQGVLAERCEQVPEVQRPGSTLACQEPHRRHAPVVQPF